MRKFIDKITPSFIRSYNATLLKNAPLGWQLQLPTITWVWLLVTVLTVPIPFLINLDNRGDDDILAVILISVLTAVLEGFLFVYILIQFNNTKTFGRRVFLNGFKEQLAYLHVFMLCMLHIIFYPLIVDLRKGDLMTVEEIRNEAVIYNQANFYFMGKSNDYRYFPSDATYLYYKYLVRHSESNESGLNDQEVYYIEKLKPMMRAYFMTDSEKIDPKYTRYVSRCPKLYMVDDNSLTEIYHNDEHPSYIKQQKDSLYFERYQLTNKSDDERLTDIKKFIKLYASYSEGFSSIHIDRPEEILQKYKSNQFNPVIYELDAISKDYAVTRVASEVEVVDTSTEIDGYHISEVHRTIAGAKVNKWSDCLMRLMVCFFVGLCLSIFLFVFKNVRLKEFILVFVYTGLLTLAVSIINVVFNGDEDFPIHVVWIVFLAGIYFSFFDRNSQHFSSIKAILILLSNLVFAFMPIALFSYFHEYLDIGKIPNEYEYCLKHSQECDRHHEIVELFRYGSLWGGIILYMLLGSMLYKKVYERLLALPLAK